MPGLGYLLRLFVFETDSYFWKNFNAHFNAYILTLTFKTAQNLCTNLQKTPLLSTTPG